MLWAPKFAPIYEQQEYLKPLLVMKFYSVAGKACTLHRFLQDQRQPSMQTSNLQDCARILIGVCNGLDAIHQKGYLHNDLKCDNVVVSDCVPHSSKAPSVWPIIIDFGKARSIKNPKSYKLDLTEQNIS